MSDVKRVLEDWLIDYDDKKIWYRGLGPGNTCRELYRAMQEALDDAKAAGDDLLDITCEVPGFHRECDHTYYVIGGWCLLTPTKLTDREHFKENPSAVIAGARFRF